MEVVDALLGSSSSTSSPESSSLPGLLGWRLFAPPCKTNMFNIVSLYKQKGYISSPADINTGWDFCKKLNLLKMEMASERASLEDLVEYATLLSVMRSFVASNDMPFLYAGMKPSYELDFELFMVYSKLATFDVQRAIDSRKIDSYESLTEAANYYDRASWFIEEALTGLCTTAPPANRVAHGQTNQDWIFSIVPQLDKMTRPIANMLILMRVKILRAEAALCRRRALDILTVADSDFFDVRDNLLEGTGVYVWSLFMQIVKALSQSNLSHAPLARYAGAMALHLKLQFSMSIAKRDLDVAREALDTEALARAIRRLDVNEFPRLSPTDRKALGEDLLKELDSCISQVNDLRDQATRLQTENITDAFRFIDLHGASSEPLLPRERDPYSIDDQPPIPLAMRDLIQQILDMRVGFKLKHREGCNFVALRESHANAVRQMTLTPQFTGDGSQMPVGSPKGRNEFDLAFNAISMQLCAWSDERRSQAMHDKDIFQEVLRMSYELGRLSERRSWFNFTLSNDDGSDPDSIAVKDAQEIENVKPVVFNYLAIMAKELGLEFKE